MYELAALLFDVDGTLAETEEIHRRAFNEAFANADLDWHWSPDLYGRLLAVTGGKERIRHYLDTVAVKLPQVADLDEYIADLHADKTRIYTRMVQTGQVPLRCGVRRLIDEARAAGVRLAIATTTTPDNVEALLRTSLDPKAETWFDVIAAGSIVPQKKPAPDIYNFTLQQLALEAGQCLALEDSENGLRSAVNASIPAVITVSYYTVGQDFTGALLVVDRLGEPEKRCTAMAGSLDGAGYIDLELLRRIHAAGQR